MSSNRALVVNLADLHAGHKLGLCNPETIWWDEGPRAESEGMGVTARYPSLGSFQEFLWGFYEEGIAYVKSLANGVPVYLLSAGDLTHGTRYPEGVMSTEIDDHIQTGYYNLLPWFQNGLNVKAVRLIHGTGVHTFEGHAENSVARLLSRDYPNIDTKTVSHSELEINNLTIDVAHHGPGPSSRDWLQGNQLRYYLRDLMLRHLHNGSPVPNIIIRAHFHTFIPPETLRITYTQKLHTTTGILLPGLSGFTNHARKVTKSKPHLTLGMIILETYPSTFRILPFTKTLDLRNKESL